MPMNKDEESGNKKPKPVVRPKMAPPPRPQVRNSSETSKLQEFKKELDTLPRLMEELPKLEDRLEHSNPSLKHKTLMLQKHVKVAQENDYFCVPASLIGILKMCGVPEKNIEPQNHLYNRLRKGYHADDAGVIDQLKSKEITQLLNSYLTAYKKPQRYSELVNISNNDSLFDKTPSGIKNLKSFEDYIVSNLDNQTPVYLSRIVYEKDLETNQLVGEGHAMVITGIHRNSSPHETMYKLMDPEYDEDYSTISGLELAEGLNHGGSIFVMGVGKYQVYLKQLQSKNMLLQS